MRVLFVHQNFPGQYRHIAPSLARRKGTQVVGLGENTGDALPGVQHVRYKAPPQGHKDTHRYVRRFETAIYRGQHVARAGLALKERGFNPDIICCHPGWGEAIYLKDVWPDAKTLYYFEFYYRSSGADVGFDPPGQPVAHRRCLPRPHAERDAPAQPRFRRLGPDADEVAGQPLPRLGARAHVGDP